MLVKVFVTYREELEKVVQQWLKANPSITIHFVSQSGHGMEGVTLTIFYFYDQNRETVIPKRRTL
jgi:hypothetical protein